MTETLGVKVRELFPTSLDRFSGKVAAELKGRSKEGGSPAVWRFVGDKVSSRLLGALDMDVFEVLARGWQFTRELKKFKDPEKYPKDETVVVHLGEHKLPPLELYSDVQVRFGPLAGPKLRFTISFDAEVDSVALEIRNARILSCGAGHAKVSVQLKYRDAELHDPIKLREVSLGRSLTLPNDGLPIA